MLGEFGNITLVQLVNRADQPPWDVEVLIKGCKALLSSTSFLRLTHCSGT